MTPEEALQNAIKLVGGKVAMAEELSKVRPITHQAVSQWKVCPEDRVQHVARAARRAARLAPTSHDLRPDLFPDGPK